MISVATVTANKATYRYTQERYVHTVSVRTRLINLTNSQTTKTQGKQLTSVLGGKQVQRSNQGHWH